MKPQVVVKQFIKSSRPKVFQAWLKPDLVLQWFSPESLKPLSFTTDGKVGGSYVHVMTGPDGNPITTTGIYMEIIENERLVFTWGKAGNAESVVTIELADQDGGCLVTLTHTKLPEDLVPSHHQGWSSALRNLETFFNGGRT